MGAILFLPFQKLQGDPVSCLPEPFGKQFAHPTPGRTLRRAGFSLVLLPLGPGAAVDKRFSVTPALAGDALEPTDSGRSDLSC